jgi:choline dehydrogenase-like flavoprotein
MTPDPSYDLIIVGSGPAASFFLLEALRHLPATARIAVLERGSKNSLAWQISRRRSSPIAADSTFVHSGNADKTWRFTLGYGGGTNCWWGGTHRFHPSDFRLNALYGQGRDWPISYDDVEPFYGETEAFMQVSGLDRLREIPRSTPFPQPPHSLVLPDEILAHHYPEQIVPQPTARAREATANRPSCCASKVCNICPVDAKFTVLNEMDHVYRDPRVTLILGAEALTVETSAGTATGVRARQDGDERVLRGETVALAANAIFNPAILLRSGFEHPILGAGLGEQLVFGASVDLAGLNGYQGSTSFSGHGLMLYDGTHRKTAGACLFETGNTPVFRPTPGRWRERLNIKLSIEDIPQPHNRVTITKDDERPVAHFEGYSDYARRGMARATSELASVLENLPVERIEFRDAKAADGHIAGTTRMGSSPGESVVDDGMIHHTARNLLCLGSSVFTTMTAMNPTLTICALSLRAARKLLAGSV